MKLFFDWKTACILYSILEPFITALLKREVPKSITKLYENLAKHAQPAIDSLFKLKEKIKESPNRLDDECFKTGVGAVEAFANYLLKQVEELKA